ncbi:MAG: hypothetical protein JNL11_06470 [Bdellovibrionaceae bacterium]|nr:hypothetical protein [Pseudobdellovibrionaceae bacterium]
MKFSLFINSHSYGKNSASKWKKIESELPFLTPVFLAPAEINSVLRKYTLNNDLIYIGGGDGTIHHLINSVFQNDQDFQRIQVGILGLGSSCSFLKSVPSVQKIHGIPTLATSEQEIKIDLGRVKFKNQDGLWESKYFVANGSLGFLALGNQLFNQPGGLNQLFKSFSTEAANNFIFLKSLFQYHPTKISVNGASAKDYLNIQFLKSKYYTGEFYFERQNLLHSGQIDFHLFDYVGRWHTLNVFYHLMTKNEYPRPTHQEYRDQAMSIKASTIIPLELDGEIYFGSEFLIECVPQKLRIMSGELL